MTVTEKEMRRKFAIVKLVLVFQTRMGIMPGKLRFRSTGLYWITRKFKGSY